MENSRRSANWRRVLPLWGGGLLCLVCAAAAQAKVTADPATGSVAVQTTRGEARFEAGTLVYLHNRLRGQTLIDATLDPEQPAGCRTALYVSDAPKAEPYWIYPAAGGDLRPAVTVKEADGDGVAVTFTGLVADPPGKARRHFPQAELTLTVRVEAQSGDLLVHVAGRSPDTPVVGSAFGYTGLATRSINYSLAGSGLRLVEDLKSEKGRPGRILEWANVTHGKRLGLQGGLWQAPVTVQASAADPRASFAVWAEDDAPRCKYLVEEGPGNAYVTYEMPPYDDNRQAGSVVWRLNTYDGGWTAAATPFADSLRRRGMTEGRAPWRHDISLVIFTNGIGSSYFDSMAAAFPPEVRPRILIWMPQAWRTLSNTRDAKTHDAYYWDNNFSEETAAAVRGATAAGFRVSGYTNPHYHWGNWQQVIDPEVGEIVKGFSALPLTCPVSQVPVQYTGNTLAYTPYREHMLRTYKHVFDNLDMSLYMDTMHAVLLDGRGRAVDGMSSYEGALAFFRAARALKPGQFIGMEHVTELGVMGGCGNYGLFFDLVWSQGWEKAKAASTHPILSYLYRDTSLQISQRVAPWTYGGARYYHLGEEIAERIGTIATTEWPFQKLSPESGLDSPEKRHWFTKIQLYARRGLRPHFPPDWEDGVMSYLTAADGTPFKYVETDYGSKLVEFPPGGAPVLHAARAWKVPRIKAADGRLHDWIGVADSGDSIGLDNEARGYVLFPEPDGSAAHLRLNALPEELAIIRATVEPDLAVVELGPRDRSQGKPAIQGEVEGTAGRPPLPIGGTVGLVTDRPLVRVAAAHGTAPALTPTGQADGHYRYELRGDFWGELAFVWREGVYAPFEPTDDYLLPVSAAPPADPGELYVVLQACDQRWNADIGGPRNPRPGTVYQAGLTAQRTDGQPAALIFFLTQPSTRSMGLFEETGQVKIEGDGPQAVAFAGVRKPAPDVVGVRHLALRCYTPGAKNVRLTRLDPIRFIRPTVAVDSTAPIDLGQVVKGAAATSVTRGITNGQAEAATAGGRTFPTVLYGAARITAPNEKRPDLQENDGTGVILTGKDAERFRLKGEHPAPDGGLLLVGADGQPGLLGGAQPERETFAVEFLGAPEPGDYTATVRIVTQAGNLGVCSAGADGEPLAGLYYVDVPVRVHVQAE